MLLDSGAGAKINARDSTGDTAIMYAAYGTGKGKHWWQMTHRKCLSKSK